MVISDRFSDATFAYQGAGRGLDWDLLLQLERLTLAGFGLNPDLVLKPDLTLWFDLPAAVAAQRLASARLPDRFEAQPAPFFAAVAGGYARRCAEDAPRFARIEADAPRPAVWQQVLAAVQSRGWLKEGA